MSSLPNKNQVSRRGSTAERSCRVERRKRKLLTHHLLVKCSEAPLPMRAIVVRVL